jgi:shikimate kinase
MSKSIDTIFLLGYMGAGKTVIGRSLSKKLGFKFYDLDNYIEQIEGKTVSDIFNERNEVYFRKIENKYLHELSLKSEKKIISTGGGTPCFKNNLEIIQTSSNTISVYLKANIETLVKRLLHSIEKRPIISHLKKEDELKEFITKHLFERSFYYEKSDVKIKTDDIELKDIVKLIGELI